MAILDRPAGLDAAKPGHALIDDHQSRGQFVDGIEGSLAGRPLSHKDKPLGGSDQIAQRPPKYHLIVNHENGNGTALDAPTAIRPSYRHRPNPPHSVARQKLRGRPNPPTGPTSQALDPAHALGPQPPPRCRPRPSGQRVTPEESGRIRRLGRAVESARWAVWLEDCWGSWSPFAPRCSSLRSAQPSPRTGTPTARTTSAPDSTRWRTGSAHRQ